MVQAEVADRLAAGPGSKDVRRAVGQGRLVRRRAAGRRGRPQRLLAGAQRRLRAGRLDAPRAAADDGDPRGGLRGASTRRSPSAARRCAAALARLAGGAEAAEAALRAAGIDPLARGEELGHRRVRRHHRRCRGDAPRLGWRRDAAAAPGRLGDRPRPGQDQPRTSGSGRAAPTASTRSSTVYQAVGLYDDVTVEPRRRRGRHHGHRPVTPTVVPIDGTNIAVRAARAAGRRSTASTAGARSRSHKEIPVAGGMAGGSADARRGAGGAATALWDLASPTTTCWRLAAELGSDVPFALRRRHRARHRPRRAGHAGARRAAPGGGSSSRRDAGCPRRRSTAQFDGLRGSPRCPTRSRRRRCWPRCARATRRARPRPCTNDLQAAALRPAARPRAALVERGARPARTGAARVRLGPDLRRSSASPPTTPRQVAATSLLAGGLTGPVAAGAGRPRRTRRSPVATPAT